jgi:type IV secretion system protein VirD4
MCVCASAWLATQWLAAEFGFQRALGPAFIVAPSIRLYTPWSFFVWSQRYAHLYPRPFLLAEAMVISGVFAGLVCASLASRRQFTPKPAGADAWARRGDLEKAGLFAPSGAILGRWRGELIAFDGPEHQLLIGASRSGKGRGHVVPTLLATNDSVLAIDIKGELAHGDARRGFPGTGGFRETLGPVLCFAPTRQSSARFNPMFEIEQGANEVRGAQNLIDVLFGAYEDRAGKDFWLRSAANIAAPVLLHVLYAEPLERKTLAVVREKLRTLSHTCEQMRRTLHRKNPASGAPEVHPEILHAAESFLAGEERMRSGIQATAESMFGVFADPLVAQNTATSDFRIGDLMCWERPVTLFLQPPASDITRLMPLMRLIVDQSGRTLMESQTHDASGRAKLRRLLVMLDEFPMLGRMPFFETMMGAMAGYGLKAFLVCQSLNHIVRAYGRDNVIVDNCGLITSFSASDNETAKRIAEMAGEVWEVRESQTERRPKPLLGFSQGSTTLREERRPLLLAADVRALDRDEQLIFAAGAKPIRAKKIRFDEEPLFARRLRAPSAPSARLTTDHDWTHVAPIGVLKFPPSAETGRRRSREPSSQGDLFGAGASKISDLALAGLRPRSQARQPRSKGI